MIRVVLDTNSLIVSIGRKSKYRPIFDAFLAGKVKLLITNEIINEYVETLERKTNAIVAQNISKLLTNSPDVDRITVYFKWALIAKDVDDNKFVDCALNGRAHFLVTDDRHYSVLKNIGFPPVTVIKTEAFLKELNKLLKNNSK